MFKFYQTFLISDQEDYSENTNQYSEVFFTTPAELVKKIKSSKKMHKDIYDQDVEFITTEINEREYINSIKNYTSFYFNMPFIIKETHQDGSVFIRNFRFCQYLDIIEKFEKLVKNNSNIKYSLHIVGLVLSDDINDTISEEKTIDIYSFCCNMYNFEDQIEKFLTEDKNEGSIYFSYVHKENFEFEIDYKLDFKIIDL